MAIRAIRDTFAMEPIYGVEVRRQVKAGTLVPPHYIVDSADVEEVAAHQPFTMGTTTPPRPVVVESPPDYAAMSLPQLKEAALERGIVVTPDAKKADILGALEK